MPPKDKGKDALKQKSLTSFFSKNPNGASSSQAKPVPRAVDRKSSAMSVAEDASSPAREPRTPAAKSANTRALASLAAASSTSSRATSTPPTSDSIDVDMLSDGEGEAGGGTHARSVVHRKRKIVADSDEETGSSKPKHAVPNSSPIPAKGRNKRQRLALALSEGEDEEDEDDVSSNFSQRLTRFKKSPVKKGKKSRASSDEDDFIAPSDEDSDADNKSIRSSSGRSSASSRRSILSGDDDLMDESDNGNSKKKKSKAKNTKPSAKATKPLKAQENTPGAGTSSFLTAAEQREQGKKNDKKAADDPYSFLQDVKDKDSRRPGEPGYDPRTLYIPSSAWKEFTPFEKQFWEIKQNHYDTVLFFQKGKFFELYEDDARIGHQEFDLKLTSRVKMSMVGVPEMSFNFWAAKFLGKGYKVGRVDQSETALGAEMRMVANKSKGKASEDKAKDKIVRRELNKVYTNGTLVDPELLTDDHAGHCIAIAEQPSEEGKDKENKFGICVLDSSTSQFNLSAFEDDICRTKLETLMRQIRPKELLFKKGTLSVSTTRMLKTILPSNCLWTSLRTVEGFDYDQTLEQLKTLFPSGEDESMEDEGVLPASVPESIREMVSYPKAIEALGCMIWYLRQLNIDKDIISMKNFNVYDPMKRGQGLTLEGQCLAHLEILLNNEGTEDGSLLKLLSRCITPFGKRLFRIWLCMPLRNVADINARLDAVQDIMDHPTFEAEFAEIAKGLPDLERIVSRIHAKNCKIKDFLKVLSSFRKLSRGLNKLADESESFKSKTILGLLRGAPDLVSHVKHVEDLFQKPNVGDKVTDELLPQKGKDEGYDNIVAEITDLENELAERLGELEKEAGFKLAYWHSAIGNKDIYLVETPTSKKAPSSWTKNSGTKNRYIVPSLQSKIRQLKEARETRTIATRNFKFRVFAEFDQDRSVWLRAIRVFAELDCLFSLAKSSTVIGSPACRPEFVEDERGSAFVDFEELRHPILCLNTNVKNFIANDLKLGGDVGKVALLTGPNMAGKSTLMRMTAIGVIMAQLGMFVPAAKARLSPVDAIITRMGAYDNMFSHASTFKVEMDECCKILREATPRSLVILDELGRGTSTYDGMAIAGAVLHQLATHTLPITFFATHYGSLTDDFAYHPNIRNMHMSTLVDDEKKELVFLYKLVEGVAESSFGTHVANLAGVPFEVVERAEAVSKQFAKQFKERLELKQKNNASSRIPLNLQADWVYLVKLATGQAQLGDDAKSREVLERLKSTVRSFLKHKQAVAGGA
ncbi:DNA mismatch repair protein msh6 [Macrolepiota fuliginosa MF-IS2]|uniref:DNA mismatch repair protein n=1 Tax=Macrolepiota fuliginosa MF-IS2 TaxID=1400762 RepID=A0A9P5XII1_9AGAR|nr:DNA mismatch repair protein msh6 [Macrolepiota fuliginosa MF-IS2]